MIITSRLSAERAPSPWKDPVVSSAVAENVLYTSIADDAVRAMSIEENADPLEDLALDEDPRIQDFYQLAKDSDIGKYKPWGDPKVYTRYEGSTKVRRGLYLKLKEMLAYLPLDVGIAYAEGFRPLKMQKFYFDQKFREILKRPDIQERLRKGDDKRQVYEDIYAETCQSVSPFIENVPTHTTGAAIDMSLFRIEKDGRRQLLDMGEFDVIAGPNPEQETFSPQTTVEQRKNRLLLLEAATRAGIVNYGYEWWHCSYGDKVWAFIRQQPNALYGLPIEVAKDPILTITKDAYFEQMAS